MVYGCLFASSAELCSCDRDYVHPGLTVSSLVLHRKGLVGAEQPGFHASLLEAEIGTSTLEIQQKVVKLIDSHSCIYRQRDPHMSTQEGRSSMALATLGVTVNK